MARKVIAFDIGGTNLRAALVENNKIIKLIKEDTPKQKDLFLKRINQFIEKLLTKEIKGIGIAFPSALKSGFIKNPPNLPIKNFNLKKYLEKKHKTKVEIFNDASCVALAESKIGCKKKDFFIITLGTGIGGGIIINGEDYSGCGYGSEIGHVFANDKFIEDLWKETKEKIKKEFKKPLLIKDLVKIKNQKSKKILQESADYLGKGLVSAINILDPEIIIIAGGPSDSGPVFLNMIKKSVKKHSFLPKTTPINWTKLKYPGILGASLLIK